LHPEQLGRLTLGEFKKLLKGNDWRERRSMEKLAQLASWIMSPHTKKPVDPKKLLKPKDEKKKVNPKQSEERLAELMAEMGIKEG
jgi:hypothetical protein